MSAARTHPWIVKVANVFWLFGVLVATVIMILSPFLIVSAVMSVAAPGAAYVRAFRDIIDFFMCLPFIVAGTMAIAHVVRNRYDSRIIATLLVWIVLLSLIGILALLTSHARGVNKLEWDAFESDEQVQFIRAIIAGKGEEVQDALRNGFSPNFSGERGINPLYVAAMTGELSMMETLLTNGYVLNRFPMPGKAEFYAPFVVISHPRGKPIETRLAMLETMHQSGFDLNAMIQKRTYIHHAVFSDQIEVLKFLLDKGANDQILDGEGESPFTSSVKYRAWRCARVLLPHAIKEDIDRSRVDIERQTRDSPPHVRNDDPERIEFIAELQQRN